MTHIVTFGSFANTTNDLALISVVETTAARVCTTDEYNNDAVVRILNAKNAKAVSAPDDADAFMSWLNK